MIIREIIDKLSTFDSEKVVYIKGMPGIDICSPHNPHSYRGYYWQLALGYDRKKMHTVAEVLSELQNSIDKQFEGWKGGFFTMNEDTDVWISAEGDAYGTYISEVVSSPDGESVHFVVKKEVW